MPYPRETAIKNKKNTIRGGIFRNGDHVHGTRAQFHSELKGDMGVDRLPSGEFKIPTLREIGTLVLQTENSENGVDTSGRRK